MRIETREQLQAIRKEAKAKIDATPIRILICAGTGCISGGSQFIYDKMKELVGDNENVEVKFEGHVPHPEVKKSGCHGFCEMGPLMRIEPLNILYVKVQPEDCEEIYNETIKNRKVIDRLVYKQNGQSYVSQESIPFYEKQTRIVLKNCGHIDAEHIEEYIAVGGYEGLEKVLFDMTKEEGLDEIFKGLNVDHIISGGQTMNPSTEDILNAIDKINADNIYVLPNNKNIILAAQQAESLVEDKNIIVIPSKTIPQGISAMIGFIPDNSPEDNKEAMIDSMSYVKTGEVTYAVRDTVIDDKEIKEGNIMGIGDEGILAVGEEIDDTTINMIKEMQDEESEIVSLYYGAEVTEEAANKLADKIAEALPEIEVEVYPGGQPIYYYIASVE